MKAEKKRALLNLKKSHLEQIQQHLSNSSDRHAEEAAIRKEIVRDQDALDRRYQAREVARKQQTLAHNAVRESGLFIGAFPLLIFTSCVRRRTHVVGCVPLLVVASFLENRPADPQ